MTSFLFWNIRNNPIQSIVANLALRHEIDVLMLAECYIPPDILLSALNESTDKEYYYVPQIGCEGIEIFTRFSKDLIPSVSDSDRYTIRHLRLPKTVDILVSIVHLPSKLHTKERDQETISRDLSITIRDAEETIGHSRTILVGDLNMSPFEDGIVMASGLNATMSRFISQERTRTIRKKDYSFFYSPMWNFLGDFNSNPPGTYYYRKAEETNLIWYIFDLVLIRPDLLEYFDIKDLAILISIGDISFTSRNGIPKKEISDHLPLFFKLNI